MNSVTIIVRTPRITALSNKLKNLEPVNRKIGGRLFSAIMQNFRDEGTWERWEPLAKATVYKRNALGMGDKPLNVTGKLIRSFDVAASNTRVRIYSRNRLAVLHHEGRGHRAGTGGNWLIEGRGGADREGWLLYPHPAGRYFLPGRGGVRWRMEPFTWHFGYPARPLLPPDDVAKQIARDTVAEYLED